MRGRDPETGQFLAPSRSQQRRDALAVLALAERLVALGERQLEAIPMPDDLRMQVRESRRINAQIARKRQVQFLAKCMRREDESVIEAIRRALEREREDIRRDSARLHRIEAWRDRLLDEGDTALSELIAQHPGGDCQKLRQLVRNARSERERERPPHAFRELFRELKTLLAAPDEPLPQASLQAAGDGHDDHDDEDGTGHRRD